MIFFEGFLLLPSADTTSGGTTIPITFFFESLRILVTKLCCIWISPGSVAVCPVSIMGNHVFLSSPPLSSKILSLELWPDFNVRVH